MEDQIYEILDDITDYLLTLTREQRPEWFRKTQYPHPIHFEMEMGDTVYTVSAHFSDAARESLKEKAERIVLKQEKNTL